MFSKLRLVSDTSVQTPNVAPSSRRFYSPVIWLNLLCLDAPIVAVTWQWLFGRIFGAQLTLSLRALLFLTAWLIYLADRFADTLKLAPGTPMAIRHEFCRKHMVAWWVTVVVIFCVDTSLALRTLDLQLLLLGGTVAFFSTIYLLLNHSLGGKWRPVPLKEKAIGVLFAAGTVLAVVAQLPRLTIAFAVAFALFAALCTFNCLCIAAWERDLDATQGKTSLLTRWPAAVRALKFIGLTIIILAAIAAVIWRGAVPLWLCLAGSAFLLVRLNALPNLPRDHRTALADLVLLTPLFWLPLSLR